MNRELDFWKNFLAKLHIKKLRDMKDGEDISHTDRRIKNAEEEITLLLKEME